MQIQGACAVVYGGDGFIGSHLAKNLLDLGAERVRLVDLKPVDHWNQAHRGAENLSRDLQEHDLQKKDACLQAARAKGIKRFSYSSSECVYNGDLQTNPDVVALKEEDAYPKLIQEGDCREAAIPPFLSCKVNVFQNGADAFGEQSHRDFFRYRVVWSSKRTRA